MTCPKCGQENKDGAFYCRRCGARLEESYQKNDLGSRKVYKKKDSFFRKKKAPNKEVFKDPIDFEEPIVENQRDEEDRVRLKQVPGKTNWAALSLTLFWGLGNRVYITLLALIPFVNIFIALLAFYFGNSWAYRAGRYKDLKTFSRVQETWNRAGFVAFILEVFALIVFLGYLFFPSLIGRLQPIQALFYVLQ